MGIPQTSDGDAASLTGQGLVSAVYQPVVELESGGVVGYEALARGPQGGELERPDALLSAARRAGLLEQVDWECRLAAVAGALDAGLDRATTLFVNVEPESLSAVDNAGRDPDLWQRAEERLDVAVELPAGALRSRPAELVRAAAACRDRGWTVVLDDVGVDAGSLAVLPLVAPDAIKLDMRGAAAPSGAHRPRLSEIASAVWAEQERTGAALVAEGIETEQQLEVALGVGATLGQGWLWGRPGALPDAAAARAASGVKAQERRPAPAGTPFELVSAQRQPREGGVALLARMSRHLERCARGLGHEAVVLASFQEAARFRGPLRARYRAIAGDAALVAVLAPDMSTQPAIGVHGASLPDDDPLREEWCVAVVAPHYAAALVACEEGRAAPDAEAARPDDAKRRFRYVLTHERELAVAVARSLVARIA